MVTDPNFQTLDAAQLAVILHRTRRTVILDLTRAPDRLPRPARRVGKQPIWILNDVFNWLRQETQPEPEELQKPPKSCPGRPSKIPSMRLSGGEK